MIKNILIPILVIGLLLGSIIYLAYLNNQNPSGLIADNNQPTPTPTQTPTPQPRITPEDNANWRSHTSTRHSFSISYPIELRVQQQSQGEVHFFQFGPTQQMNTEFYDGISLTFNSGNLGNQTLQQFVQSEYEEKKNDPITENITDLEPISIANLQGYNFIVTGLGSHKYIYLPKGNSSYLEIIDSTVDPTNQGFENTVAIMLSTLKTPL